MLTSLAFGFVGGLLAFGVVIGVAWLMGHNSE